MAAFRKDTPGVGDVHVDVASGPDWKKRTKPALGAEACALLTSEVIAKGVPTPLYVYRPVLNGADLVKWAKDQGFSTTLPADDMHVTIAHSSNPVDWMAAGESYSCDPKGELKLAPGGPRQLANLGPLGQAAVLLFASNELNWRHEWLEEIGCSWDWPEYQPHITISFDAEGLDLSALQPYQGPIVFGPEVFEPINENWKDSLVEKFDSFFKVAGITDHGLVFGWGIICKDGGVDYVDTQGNSVPEDAMVEATTDFMKSARVHGDMHSRGIAPEGAAGVVVHSFPLTTEIAKAMGIETKRTGWLVGTAPDPAMLAKFKSGDYTGFSIGGEHLEIDGKLVEA